MAKITPKQPFRYILIAVMLGAFLCLGVSDTFANPPAGITVNVKGSVVNGGGGGGGGFGFNFGWGGGAFESFCPGVNAGFTVRIVECLEAAILDTAYQFIYAIYPPLRTAIYAVLTLGVIFYGVMMVMGAIEKAGRDTMILLLKVAAIIYFTANMAEILDWLLGALEELLLIVSTYSIFSFPLKCPGFLSIWERSDCLLDVVIGVNTARTLADGMLAFFFHNFAHGSAGVIIGIVGLWMAFALVMGIFKAIYTYLLAFLTLTMMIVVGILFLPLVLFKNTYQYFETWARICISLVLQPVILFAYMNVVLAAYDIVLYSGEFSVFRTFAGAEVDSPGFNIHEYMYGNGLIVDEEEGGRGMCMDLRSTDKILPVEQLIDGAYLQYGETGGEAADECYNDVTNQIPLKFPLEPIDYEAAAGLVGYAGEVEMLDEMMAAVITAGLVAYILITLLDYIPKMAEDLAGGSAGVRGAPQVAEVGSDLPLNMGRIGGAATNTASRIGGMVGRR